MIVYRVGGFLQAEGGMNAETQRRGGGNAEKRVTI
jgi:hypothetical protein